MATSSNFDFSVDLTICSVCLERYKTPRILPCAHNLCHLCLSAHIESSCENSDPPLGFSCPICNMFVPGPGTLGQYPTKDWANHFPENVFLNLNAGKLASVSSIYCNPCEREGEKDIQAESWCLECTDAMCKRCIGSHKKFKTLQSHQIIPLTSSETNVKMNFQETAKKLECCQKHMKRNIEFLCNTHQVLCCSLCIIQEHRRCEYFSTITQIADACSEEEKTELIGDIKQLEQKIDSLLQGEKQNIADLESKTDIFAEEIRKMTEEMVNQLKNMEEEYLHQLAKSSKEGKQNIQKSVGSLEQRKMYLLYWLKILTTTTEDETKEKHFIKMRKTKQAMKEIARLPLIRSNIDLKTEISDGIEKIDSLGTLFNVQTTFNHVNIDDIKLVEILVEAVFEVEMDAIYGGCFLPNGRLLLCDNSSPRCLIFLENGSLVQEVELPGNPWDAFVESDGRILITMPDAQRVVVLEQNTLAIENTIDLSCACRGISKIEDRYLIGTRGFIEEFSSKFAPLKSRLVDITDDIAVDKTGCVVFGDSGTSTITKEDKDHNVLFTYMANQLAAPIGLAIDSYGYIYVNYREDDCIHILSQGGHLLRTFGFTGPQCIKFQENSQRFFVVSREGIVKISKTTW